MSAVRLSLLALLATLLLPPSLGAQPAAPPLPGAPAPLPGTPAPAAPAPNVQQLPPAAPAPPPEPAWLPRHVAELQILDKIGATHQTRDVAVGSSATVGTLTVKVEACYVRPPDQERDAAAYVEITDRNPDVPAFQGWLLAAEPGASVFEHPIYDVHVTGCH
jgi:hypothetical protein